MSSKLLIDEYPLMVPPTLAKKLGLSKSVMLQQLHFWVETTKTDPSKAKTHYFDGRWWVYNTYQFWQKYNFIFASVKTIERNFSALEKEGLIERRPHENNNLGYWHTINYDAVNDLIGAGNGLNPDLNDDETPRQNVERSENGTPRQNVEGLGGTSRQNVVPPHDKMSPHTETTTETTKTETNINRPAAVPAVFDPTHQLTGPPKESEEAEKEEAPKFDADHPLAQVLRKFNHGKAIPSKIARTLETPIQIRREEGTTKYPSLLVCYDEWAGFPDFVESRIGQFIEAGKGDLKGVVGNLRNFDKTDTSFYGWFKWKEENKRLINQNTTNEKAEREAAGDVWLGYDADWLDD